MKKLVLFLSILIIGSVTNAQEIKEPKNSDNRKAKYEAAIKVLQSKSFGVQISMIKILADKPIKIEPTVQSFIGFEDNTLIIQSIHWTENQKMVCRVRNYSYSTDKKGNVVVVFDYIGRLMSGKMVISMNHGNNNAEVTISKYASNDKPLIVIGEILPAGKCSYVKIAD